MINKRVSLDDLIMIFKTIEEVYDHCLVEGTILPLEDFSPELIARSLRLVEEDLLTAQDAVTKKRWTSAYKLFYGVLQHLVESLLLFDKVKTKNDLSLFTSLCCKHEELELDWDFFERVRMKRKSIEDDALSLSEKDWKGVELQFKLYISSLKREVERKMSEFPRNIY